MIDSIAATGLKRAVLRSRDVLADPLFCDPAFYLRDKQASSSSKSGGLNVLGAGQNLHADDSYEHGYCRK